MPCGGVGLTLVAVVVLVNKAVLLVAEDANVGGFVLEVADVVRDRASV